MHDTKNDVRSACHCLSGWCWIQGDAPRISKKQIISIRIHRESMKSRRNHLRFFIYLCDMKIALNINSCRCHSITV